MGLDMNVYARTSETSDTEIAYFRKHYALHNWFEGIYRENGGTDSFNGIPLDLTLDKLEELKILVLMNHFPRVPDLTNQEHEEYLKEKTLEMVDKAIEYCNNGYSIYYDSSW